MFKRFLKNEKGLTLIELLAVIVILGIISAIAVPSIGGLINKTKEDAQVAEAVQIINAARIYSTTNPSDTSITRTELEPYLDKVKDTDFTVTVTKDSNNKFTYYLSGHPAVTIVNGSSANSVSEADLQDYSEGKKQQNNNQQNNNQQNNNQQNNGTGNP
jgi:type IV pilus assembly protein PilA